MEEAILSILDKNNIAYEKINTDIVIKNMNKNKLKLIVNTMYGHDADELAFADILDKNNEYYYVHIVDIYVTIIILIDTFKIAFDLEYMENYDFEEMYSRYRYLAENYIFYNNDNEEFSYILQDGKKYDVELLYERDLVITSEDNSLVFSFDSIEDIVLIMSKNFPDSIKQADIKIALK
jgi:hypothetical protein